VKKLTIIMCISAFPSPSVFSSNCGVTKGQGTYYNDSGTKNTKGYEKVDFLLINSRNIKISLSKTELDENCISADGLCWNDEKTRCLMRKVLATAYEKCGFEWESEKLSVSVFPSVDGGCELFVTKRGNSCTKSENDSSFGTICFCNGAENLFCACEKLKEKGFSGRSSLYLSENGEFVLICENRRKLPSYMKKIENEKIDLSFMKEHGRVYEATSYSVAYICEHMTALAKNDAVLKMLGTF